jgi:carbonic anhydrase
MSCPNATAPINIDLAKIEGKCDLKCDYNFNYSTSSCIATNRGNYISLSYDNQTNSPVLYNSSPYNVAEVRIYTPSLHSYSGSKADGELIVVHDNIKGGEQLLTCVPIRISNSASSGSALFNAVINTMASSAPIDGESTNVNFNGYNLNNIIPRKPFFTYSASEPYQPCTSKVNYIVFDTYNSTLGITSDTLTKMKSFIKSNTYGIKSGASLFYNEKGPGKDGSGTDEIHIDCQPIGSSEEEKFIVNSQGSSNISFQDILNNKYTQYFLAVIIFLIILFVGIMTLNGMRVSKKIEGQIKSLTGNTNTKVL